MRRLRAVLPVCASRASSECAPTIRLSPSCSMDERESAQAIIMTQGHEPAADVVVLQRKARANRMRSSSSSDIPVHSFDCSAVSNTPSTPQTMVILSHMPATLRSRSGGHTSERTLRRRAAEDAMFALVLFGLAVIVPVLCFNSPRLYRRKLYFLQRRSRIW